VPLVVPQLSFHILSSGVAPLSVYPSSFSSRPFPSRRCHIATNMSIVSPANIGGVADPRVSTEPDAIGSYRYDENTGRLMYRPNRSSHICDPSIQFEEYQFYANIERKYEQTLYTSDHGLASIFNVALGRLKGKDLKQDYAVRTGSIRPSAVELNDRKRSSVQGQMGEYGVAEVKSEPSQSEPVVSDEEWQVASRAARTATWGAYDHP